MCAREQIQTGVGIANSFFGSSPSDDPINNPNRQTSIGQKAYQAPEYGQMQLDALRINDPQPASTVSGNTLKGNQEIGKKKNISGSSNVGAGAGLNY
tara:strand:- start:62 stop:352 length:291 start_codon:yes stop_codon:yes gene_type:complete